jgi:hypothetical protein
VAQGSTIAPPLVLKSNDLPAIALQQEYHFQLEATGGRQPLQWEISRGTLPPGIFLDPHSGTLSGMPRAAGEFHFTVTVTDSGTPPESRSKDYVLGAPTPLLLEWSQMPVVSGHRIAGGVKVSNSSTDDFDLTVIIVAVSEIGKAFALGYQHLELRGGLVDFDIPFASTVPQGSYVVHADAVAEVPSKNAIYRRRLQTDAGLQVTAGP